LYELAKSNVSPYVVDRFFYINSWGCWLGVPLEGNKSAPRIGCSVDQGALNQAHANCRWSRHAVQLGRELP